AQVAQGAAHLLGRDGRVLPARPGVERSRVGVARRGPEPGLAHLPQRVLLLRIGEHPRARPAAAGQPTAERLGLLDRLLDVLTGELHVYPAAFVGELADRLGVEAEGSLALHEVVVA